MIDLGCPLLGPRFGQERGEHGISVDVEWKSEGFRAEPCTFGEEAAPLIREVADGVLDPMAVRLDELVDPVRSVGFCTGETGSLTLPRASEAPAEVRVGEKLLGGPQLAAQRVVGSHGFADGRVGMPAATELEFVPFRLNVGELAGDGDDPVAEVVGR